MVIKIRTTSTNTYLVSDEFATQCDFETGNAVFTFHYKDGKGYFNESQYYRVQIAFVDLNGDIGYYSTVGIIKCIAKPDAYISASADGQRFDVGQINMFNNTFTGNYVQDTTFGDSTEKAYSYNFSIYESDGNLIATSGDRIHDATQDAYGDRSSDSWLLYNSFEDGTTYYLQYSVTTLNGLTVSSPKYKIMKVVSVPIEFNIKLHANNNFDNGYIDVVLQGELEQNEALKSGNYQRLHILSNYDPTTVYFIKSGLNTQEDLKNSIIIYKEKLNAWATAKTALNSAKENRIEETLLRQAIQNEIDRLDNVSFFSKGTIHGFQVKLENAIGASNTWDLLIILLDEILETGSMVATNLNENLENANDELGNQFVKFKGTYEEWQRLFKLGFIYVYVESEYWGEKAYSGSFVITRSSAESNFTEWIEISRFTLQSQFPSTIHHRDMTVEQGIEYKYALQQYNIHDVYSEKEYQSDANGKYNTTIADFEDIFLSDGERQLRVRFNPKIAKFTTTIPEKKVETVGSKYPFIFRNGSVAYKEFSIAGLISYQMDEAKLFLNQAEMEEAGILEYKYARGFTSIDGYTNSRREASFRLKKIETDIRDPYTNAILYTEVKYVMVYTKQNNQDYATQVKNAFFVEGTDDGIGKWLGEIEDLASYYDDLTIFYRPSTAKGNEVTTLELNNLGPKLVFLNKTTKVNLYSKNEPILLRYTTEREGGCWQAVSNTIVGYKVDRSLKLTDEPDLVRLDKNLTGENIRGERYFKLKVLDWLTNGKIKLFRSATEGNYLVRLIKTQLKPQQKLGRMLHDFSCTAYEIDELTYDNLIKYGIIVPKAFSNFEEQWGSIDVRAMMYSDNKKLNEDGFVKITPDNIAMNTVMITHFAPGDQIKVVYDEDGETIFTVGVTGSLELNKDERNIIEVWAKMNPSVRTYNDFERELIYSYTSVTLTKFDTISDIKIMTRTAEQFVGPKTNILAPYDLRYYAYGKPNEEKIVEEPWSPEEGRQHIYDDLVGRKHLNYNIETLIDENGNDSSIQKFSAASIDILHVWKRKVIPIYAYSQDLNEYTHFGLTPFYQPYINGQDILTYTSENNDNNSKKIRVQTFFNALNKNNLPSNLLNAINEVVQATSNKLSNKLFNLSDIFSISNIALEEKKEALARLKVSNNFINNLTDNTSLDDILAEIHLITVNYADLYVNNYSDEGWEETGTVNPNDLYSILVAAGFSNDDSLIFQLFVKNEQTGEWEPSTVPGFKYYDNYIKSWWEGDTEYNPSFNINDEEEFMIYDEETLTMTQDVDIIGDNNIFLDEIEEITLYNLGKIKQINLGNGVIAEVTPQMRIVDYDIETSNSEVREAKNAYLKAKADYAEALDSVKVDVGDPQALRSECEVLQKKLLAIEDQLNSTTNTSSYKVIKQVAEERMIEQKQAMWSDRFEQIKEILNYLQKIKIYKEMDTDDEEGISIIKDYILNDISSEEEIDNIIKPYLDSLTEKILNIQNGEISENDLFSESNRGGIQILDKSDSSATVEKKSYDFIDDFKYIDIDFYTNQKEKSTIMRDEYAEQILELRAQQGELYGGDEDSMDEDFDELNPPPENTILYYKFLIKQLDDKYSSELIKINKEKADYVNRLLQIGISNTAQILEDIQGLTGKYLKDNAINLITLLNEYIEDKNQKLDTIKTLCVNDLFKINKLHTNARQEENRKKDILGILLGTIIPLPADGTNDPSDSYIYTSLAGGVNELASFATAVNRNTNSNKIKGYLLENEPDIAAYIKAFDLYGGDLQKNINALQKEVALLESIKNHPGTEGQDYNVDLYFKNQQVLDTFNNTTKETRDDYVNQAEANIRSWLDANQYNLQNLVFITKDTEINDRAFAILDLFTDKVNESQVTNIKRLLNDYYPADNDLTVEANKLVQQIKAKDAIYAKRIKVLNDLVISYNEAIAEIQLEIDNIEIVVNQLEDKKAEQETLLDEANEQLRIAKESKDVLESPEFFENIIVKNKNLCNNIEVINKYLDWISLQQQGLLQQAGQVYGDITTGDEYGLFLKKYIDAYAEEAFAFLHKYNSIIEDLRYGFDTEDDDPGLSPGLERYMYDLRNYDFSVYQDILYIVAKNFDQQKANDFLNRIKAGEDSTTTEESRLQTYAELKFYLSTLFKGDETSRGNVETTFGVIRLAPRIGTSEASVKQSYCLVKLQKWSEVLQERLQEYYDILNIRNSIQDTDSTTWRQLQNESIRIVQKMKPLFTLTHYNVLYNSINSRNSKDLDLTYLNKIQIYYTQAEEYYPVIISLGEDSSIISNLNNGHYNIIYNGSSNYELLRSNDKESYKIISVVQNSTNNYIPCIYNSEGFYYDLLSTFDNKNQVASASDPNFDEKIKNEGGAIWFTTNMPFTYTTQLHSYLYNTNPATFTLNIYATDSTKYLIEPSIYKTIFDDYIGLIVHDLDKNGNEYGSYFKLLELDTEKFALIAEYFNTFKEFELEIFKEDLSKLREHQNLLSNYKKEQSEWVRTRTHCELVLEEYDINEILSTDSKRLQLEALLQTAIKKIKDYNELIIAEQKIITDLMTDPLLQEYNYKEQVLVDIREKLILNENEFNTHYDIYRRKIDHYLNLLFNNIPYGISLDKEVMNNKDLVNIDGHISNVYNFGISYALERIRKYMIEQRGIIRFKEVVSQASKFEEYLNINLPLVHLWDNIGHRNDLSYFIKNNKDEFIPYLYLNEDQWRTDVLEHKVYYTNYPYLTAFINYVDYYPVTELITYNEDNEYYIKDGDNFILQTIANDQDFNILKETLFIKGNGGLRKILLYLSGDENDENQYLKDIKEAYNGTFELMRNLLAQIRGDTMTIEELYLLKEKYLKDLQDKQELLIRLNEITINVKPLINDIYLKLAEFLRVLTVKYITEVERNYGVI